MDGKSKEGSKRTTPEKEKWGQVPPYGIRLRSAPTRPDGLEELSVAEFLADIEERQEGEAIPFALDPVSI